MTQLLWGPLAYAIGFTLVALGATGLWRTLSLDALHRIEPEQAQDLAQVACVLLGLGLGVLVLAWRL